MFFRRAPSFCAMCQAMASPSAVGVGRQVDVLLVLGGLLDVLEHLRLALDDVVLGREVVLEVDPELRLGQVHHVADGGLHLVVPPEVLAERLGFGRRLDDDEVLGHVLHAARRQKRLPGSWQTRPRSSSARSVSSAAPPGGTSGLADQVVDVPPLGTDRGEDLPLGALSAASAAAARRAASRGSSLGQRSPITSSAHVTSRAPCRISPFGPRWPGTPAGPWDGEQVAILLEGAARSNERAAVLGGLDHDGGRA